MAAPTTARTQPTDQDPLRDYTVEITTDPATVARAQELRYEVFGREMGAQLHTTEPGRDVDELDQHCDHLVVTHQPTAEVVGTYRLLPPGRTAALYSASEFDVTALDTLRPQLIEAGRSCVRADHRTGAVVNLMWSGLAGYVLRSGHRYLAGCASVPLHDGGDAAAHTRALADRKHTAPAEFRVTPRNPWQGEPAAKPSYAKLPPLLRGYLRLGAWVCGAPAHDPDFEVADFFMLLPLDRVDPRYVRYFTGGDSELGV